MTDRQHTRTQKNKTFLENLLTFNFFLCNMFVFLVFSAFHSMSQNDVIRNDANSKTNFRTSLKRRMNFECHVCGKRLPSRREFVGHMNGRHLGQKPFSCEMCGRQFAYMTSLPVHRKTCPARRLAQSSGQFPLSAGNTTSQNPFNTLDRTSQY